ncbi:MAG: ATP synthase F1 subunit epsilon [Candidatus Levybacteria bacterium CG_4_9_14_3_um_filter_35_16]|nr:MAG: ATP synthase F1 subunit epsilon [Candidatus Levybacteria bacterium CG22_combo_CG10-13_8_21_14_all_35_11]PJA91208.1 MAG: ATP synthase F1 subunit epsilon [Candidatus Levybacteria bacterium CG_4_9_14_3_um_filter_35_16]PJC54860.1 MAG: ATP synthase F1 subunit epsilon [Candidatus Levybacteria bacterium CG_4_9_14_0_2_um_filter_35_21]
MNLHLEIITPEKIVYKDDVSEVTVKTDNGQISILPGHVNLLTKVLPCEMIVKKDNQEHFLAITGGFLEINNNNLNLLADYAIRAEDIEIAKIQEAQKKAENMMKDKASEKEFRVAEAELQKALLQLHVASKRGKRKTS